VLSHALHALFVSYVTLSGRWEFAIYLPEGPIQAS